MKIRTVLQYVDFYLKSIQTSYQNRFSIYTCIKCIFNVISEMF